MRSRFDWNLALELSTARRTAAQIATALGCDHATVLDWARRNGIVLTKYWELPKAKFSRSDVTQEVLRAEFDYSPATGAFTHKRDKPPRARKGDEVGHIDSRNPNYSRRTMMFRGHGWIVSRVIWMWVHGVVPKGHIDHINGDPMDNRLCNLRDVPQRMNSQNKRRAANTSKTGVLGVSFHHNGATPYRARIFSPGDERQIRLGDFATPEAAHEAYVEAKRLLHPGCTL